MGASGSSEQSPPPFDRLLLDDIDFDRTYAKNFLKKNRRKLEVEDKLIGLVELDAKLAGTLATKVRTKLQWFSKLNELPFSAVLQKRLELLLRIKSALLRQLEREQLLRKRSVQLCNNGPTTATAPTELPLAMQLAMRLFESVVRQAKLQRSPDFVNEILSEFSSMLMAMPPLALQKEGTAVLDPLRAFLLSVLHVEDGTDAQPGIEQTQAAACLIAMAVAKGSLVDLLWVTKYLLFSATATGPSAPQLPEPVRHYLLKWTAPAAELSTGSRGHFDKDDFVGAWTVHWTTQASSPAGRDLRPFSLDVEVVEAALRGQTSNAANAAEIERHDEILSPPEGPDPSSSQARLAQSTTLVTAGSSKVVPASLTTNGKYLYLATSGWLVKVGSGADGTTMGYVYAKRANFRPKEEGWIACVGSKLYFRSPATAPDALAIYDAETLADAGSVPANDVEGLTVEKNYRKGTGRPVSRSPLFTDGRLLFLVEEKEASEPVAAVAEPKAEPNDERASGCDPSTTPAGEQDAAAESQGGKGQRRTQYLVHAFDPQDGMRRVLSKELKGMSRGYRFAEVLVGYTSLSQCSYLRRHGATATVVGKRVYILAGTGNYIYSPLVDMFDPDSLTWQQHAASGNNYWVTSQHTTCRVGRKLIMFGGKRDSYTVNNVYCFDTDKNEWSEINMSGTGPAARFGHCADAIGDRIYIFGGQTVTNENPPNYTRFGDTFLLDAMNNKWNQLFPKGEQPEARTNATLTAYKGKLYLFGGFNGEKFFNDLHRYDPTDNTWTLLKTTGTIPSGRAAHTATILGNKLFVFGGRVALSERSNELFELDMDTLEWTQPQVIGKRPSPRAAHCAVAVGTQLYIMMGRSDSGNEQDVYVLDTDTSCVLSRAVLASGAFFCDGQRIGVLLPPGVAPNPSPALPLVEYFDPGTGLLTETHQVQHSALGTCVAYDPFNRQLWSFNTDWNKFTAWRQIDISNPHSPLATGSSADVAKQLTLPDAAVIVLEKLAELAKRYMPDQLKDLRVGNVGGSKNKSDAVLTMFENFTVEAREETFVLLRELLERAADKAACATPEPALWHRVITFLLRLTLVNVARLVKAYKSIAELGIKQESLDRLCNLLLSRFVNMPETRATACQILILAIDVFWPDSERKSRFLLELLSDALQPPSVRRLGTSQLLDQLIAYLSTRTSTSVLEAVTLDSGKQLSLLVNTAFEEASQMLSSALAAASSPGEGATNAPSRAVILLHLFQKDLLMHYKLLDTKEEEELEQSGMMQDGTTTHSSAEDVKHKELEQKLKDCRFNGVLQQYAHVVFKRATEFAEKAFEMHKRIAPNALSVPLNEVLRKSFFGDLVPALATCLLLVPPQLRLAKKLLPQVIELVKAVDDFAMLPTADGAGEASAWLLDFEKTLIHLGGTYLSTTIPGGGLEAQEVEYEKLLDSKLLAHGMELRFLPSDTVAYSAAASSAAATQDDAFLEDFVENRGLAGRMVEFINNFVAQDKNFENFSEDEPLVLKAERAAIAAMLKHKGLVNEALEFADQVREAAANTPAEPPQVPAGSATALPSLQSDTPTLTNLVPPISLLKVWYIARKDISRWLQRNKVLDLEKDNNSGGDSYVRPEGDTEDAAGQSKRVEEITTKFYKMVQEVIDKSQFLLKFYSYSSQPPSTSDGDDGASAASESPGFTRMGSSSSLASRRQSLPSATLTRYPSVESVMRQGAQLSSVSAEDVRNVLAGPQAQSSSPAIATTAAPAAESTQFLEAWKAVRARKMIDRDEIAKSEPNEIGQLVLRFLKNTSLPVAPLAGLVHRRRRRALTRIFGLSALITLLKSVSVASVLGDVVRYAALALSGNHYLHSVLPCGHDLQAKLRQHFIAVYRTLAALLKDSSRRVGPIANAESAGENALAEGNLRLLILDAWSVEFRELDHEFLHSIGIFSILKRFMTLHPKETRPPTAALPPADIASTGDETQEGEKKRKELEIKLELQKEQLRDLAWTLFRYLAMNVSKNALAAKAEAASRPVSSAPKVKQLERTLGDLHKSIFELLFAEIEAFLVYFSAPPEVMATATPEGLSRRVKEETYCYDVLLLLASICTEDMSKRFLSSRRFVSLLLQLLPLRVSPRIQRMIFRLCRMVLPMQNAENLAGLIKKGRPLLETLFEWIGTAYWTVPGKYISLADEERASSSTCEAGDSEGVDYHMKSGAMALATASEVVMLLRHLMTESPAWRRSVSLVVAKAIKQIPRIVDELSTLSDSPSMPSAKDTDATWQAIAALTVIGGHIDILRPGGRVELVDTDGRKKLGTVIDLDHGRELAQIIVDRTHGAAATSDGAATDDEATAPRVIGFDKLTPITEIAPNPAHFTLSGDVVESLRLFFRPPPTDTAGDGSDHALYILLKSKAIKALAVMVRDAISAKVFLEHQLISPLLGVGHVAANREYVSVDKLEEWSTRISERAYELLRQPEDVVLYERRTAADAQAEATVAAETIVTMESTLPHSPLRKLPFKQPTKMLCEGAGVVFEEGDELTFTCVGHNRYPDAILVRGDLPIPDSVPAFYFEMRVLEEGCRGYNNNNIGIGLYPCSEKLSGMPGYYNGSYGYLGMYGYKYCYRTAGSGENYAAPFGRGDVVGCLWTRWDGRLKFTKNGTSCGTAFKHISGRFYPVIGFTEYGTRISVNFGQKPFRYDFAKMLYEALSKRPIIDDPSAPAPARKSKARRTIGPAAPPPPQLRRRPAGNIYYESESDAEDETRRPQPIPDDAEEDNEFDISDTDGEGWTGQVRTTGNENYMTSLGNEGWSSADDLPEQDLFNGLAGDANKPKEVELDKIKIGVFLTVKRDAVTATPAAKPTARRLARRPNKPAGIDGGSFTGDTATPPTPAVSVDVVPMGDDPLAGPSNVAGMGELKAKQEEEEEEERPKEEVLLQAEMEEQAEGEGNALLSDSTADAPPEEPPMDAAEEGIELPPVRHEADSKETVPPSDAAGATADAAKESEEWPALKMDTLGKTGTVVAVDLAKKKVLLQFFAGDTGARYRFWYSPWQVTHCLRAVAPYVEQQSIAALRDDMAYVEGYLSNLYARHAILSLLSNWPVDSPFDIAALGGYSCLVEVLELAAAECFLGNRERDNKGTAYSMERLRKKLQEMIRDDLASREPYLTRQVCQECLFHVEQAAKLGSQRGSGFVVTADSIALDKECATNTKKPNIHLGVWMLDLLLEQCPDYVREHFYQSLFVSMVDYVAEKTTPAKSKLFLLLIRLVECFGVPQNALNLARCRDKLDFLEEEAEVRKEKIESGTTSGMPSAAFQRLLELLVVLRRFRLKQSEETADTPRVETEGDTAPEPATEGKRKQKVSDQQAADSIACVEEGERDDEDKQVFKTPEEKEAFGERKWFIQSLADIREVSDVIVNHKPLPLFFVAQVWFDMHVQSIVVESKHPYDNTELKGEIYIPSAASLAVTFDSKSRTENAATLYFSKLADGGEIIARFSGPYSWYAQTFDLDHFYWQFQPAVKGLRAVHEFCCHTCGESPIFGVLFVCINCDHFLCDRCRPNSNHARHHVFMKVRRPLPSDFPRYTYRPLLYGSESDVAEHDEGDLPEHTGVTCSHCGMNPIVGTRYKCLNCASPDYNLCDMCEAEDYLVIHRNDHVFLELRHPLPPTDDPQTDPPATFYPEASFWGFKFTVTATFEDDVKARTIRKHHPEIIELSTSLNAAAATTPPGFDAQLTQWVNQVCDDKNTTPTNLQLSELTETNPPEVLYPLLHDCDPKRMFDRFVVLRAINNQLSTAIKFIDLSQSSQTWSLGHRICQLRPFLFKATKMAVWEEIITQTAWNGTSPSITLDRRKAAEERDSKSPTSYQATVFYQGFRQLQEVDPASLRSTYQGWNARFEGESGIDVGGVFRDSITEFCSELRGPALPLFIKCPNAQDQQGKNQDKYMPNPARNSPEDLAMFEFVGKLMGVVLRTKELLPLDLPSVVWKPLVGMPVERADIEDIDVLCCRGVDILRNEAQLRAGGIDPATFHETICYVFTTNSSDGREIELKPEGKTLLVRWEDRLEYAALIEQYKLHEVDAQVGAIRRGLDSVIPAHVLSLFTWQELELLVCGRPDIDLEILQKNTTYSGCSADSKEIKMLWEVLRSFTMEERTMFLRFVWGRSRLPVTTNFPTKFNVKLLERHGPNHDMYLPSAHTCFFTLDLPAYSTKEIMREKILKAITMCTSVENA